MKQHNSGGSYRSNFSHNVLTDSVTRALELFFEEYPGADVHSVLKRDKVDGIQFDPRLANDDQSDPNP